MERFPDGEHVRLRSREQGGFLHADEDGRGVSISLGLTSIGMAWRVDRVLHDGSTSLLLHSAAYRGRYLAASSDAAPRGHRAFLGDCDDAIQWTAVASGNSGYVVLRHVSNRLLGAIDGRGNGVCIDVAENQSTLMQWKVEPFPTSPSARLPAPAAAMEQFRYGSLVRLQSPVHGGYLHADEDGMAVSLCWRRESMNTAWQVQRVLHHGSTRVRLQSAAHGRYLAALSDPAPPGHLGHRVVLRDCDGSLNRILWETVGSGGGGGYILLRHVSNRLLRANNGRRGGVSIDVAGVNRSAMMHWKVEAVPAPARAPPSEVVVMEQFPDGAYVRLRSRVTGRCLRADEDGMRVYFRPDRGSLNAAWRVHRVLHHGTSRVLLQSAAYGRYLGYYRELPNSLPVLVQSVYYNDIQQQNLHWEGRSHPAGGIFLVNGERPLINLEDDTTPLDLELIPTRSGPTPILVRGADQAHRFRRLVIYVQADGRGNIDFRSARAMVFAGTSVSELRARITHLRDEFFPERITMCIWGGSFGRLIPLTNNLPFNSQTIEVVIFESFCQAALGLQYPLVEAD